MAASRIYHLGALAQIWPEANRQSYGAGAVDSIVSSARIAGGLGGTWNLQDPDGIERQWTDLRFALAFPFSDQFFLGAGGRHLWLKEDGDDGEIGSSAASGGLHDEQIVRGFSFDAGATLKPSAAICDLAGRRQSQQSGDRLSADQRRRRSRLRHREPDDRRRPLERLHDLGRNHRARDGRRRVSGGRSSIRCGSATATTRARRATR